MQITYVEPYFDDFELRKRRLESEKNYGISECWPVSFLPITLAVYLIIVVYMVSPRTLRAGDAIHAGGFSAWKHF